MHLQPVFSECEVLGFGVSEHLFQNGFCIPSGSSLTDFQRDRVVGAIRAVFGRS
jgi:dTDP-4-amino-4,6-dideoxygalactose transaminase